MSTRSSLLSSGVARALAANLMKAFAEVAAARGASKMFSTTGGSNEPPRRLYDSLGGSLAAQGPTANYWFGLPLR